MKILAGTCVAVDGNAVLLRGPSGAGKSDLALRLIEDGAVLVADDQTALHVSDGALTASAPETIRGMLEVRGLGILRMAYTGNIPLVAVIELVPRGKIERMPEPETTEILGCELPVFRLFAFDASAPMKVRLALRLATGNSTAV